MERNWSGSYSSPWQYYIRLGDLIRPIIVIHDWTYTERELIGYGSLRIIILTSDFHQILKK